MEPELENLLKFLSDQLSDLELKSSEWKPVWHNKEYVPCKTMPFSHATISLYVLFKGEARVEIWSGRGGRTWIKEREIVLMEPSSINQIREVIQRFKAE